MQSITHFARRRKLVTGMVSGALVVTVLGVVVAYWWSNRRGEKPLPPTRPVPEDVHQQLSGYTSTRSDEGRQVFSIRAARTVAFKQGKTTVLEDVYVELFGKDGHRRDVLRTHRCDYNAQSGNLFSPGAAQIELNADPSGKSGVGNAGRPVVIETSQLSFRQRASVVASDEPVQFRIGSIAGSSRGVSYAANDGRLVLRSEVKAEMQLAGSAQPPLKLTATRARYDKGKGHIALTGPVGVSQANRRAEAASATIYLDDQNRVTRAVFEGPVHAAQTSTSGQMTASAARLLAEFDAATNELRSAVAEGNVVVESRRPESVSRLNARKVTVAFAGNPAQAQKGIATGEVRMFQEFVAGARTPSPQASTPESMPTSKKEMTAKAVRFTFQSAGRSLKDGATVGAGRLVLVPLDPGVGERIVRAGRFLMSFDAQSRLKTLRGERGTRINFQPAKNAPPGSPPQESTADRLVALLDPATQTVRTMDQIGNFQWRAGDRRATAERASYQAASESMTLTGKPLMWDAEMRARAEKVVLDLRTDTAEGLGNVQSTHLGNGPPGDPTSVLADRAVAQRHSQTVHYEGHVRAWRGTDVVESAALDVFRAERRVKSGSKVLTSHMQPAALVNEPSAKNGKRQTSPVTIRAERLEYFDEGRKACYRGKVRLQSENTTLDADSLDAYFTRLPTGDEMELDHAIADGNVKVTQPGRRARGQHGEYFSADGKIILTGGPPNLYDAEKGFTTGRSLTFYSHDDRLFVSGGDESPTFTRHRIEQ